MESQISTTLKALAGEGDFYAAPLELASLKDEHREALIAEYLRMFTRFRSYIRDGIEQSSIRPLPLNLGYASTDRGPGLVVLLAL